MHFILALPAGLALSSAGYFFWLFFTGGLSSMYPFAEGSLLLLILTILCIRNRKKDRTHSSGLPLSLPSPATILLFLALVFAAFMCFTISFKLANLNPWGYWDAWARINLKARFLYSGGEKWQWIFQNAGIYHHDYPLLLQCTVARFWVWDNAITLATPKILSITWGICSLAILFSVVAWLRSAILATIISLVYLAYMPLPLWSAMQYADIPLACYMTLACAMLIASQQFPGHFRRFSFLAGFFAGSAAWCKNEGLVFAMLIIIWWAFLGFRRRQTGIQHAAAALFAGLCIIGSATVLLKLGFASESDLASENANLYGLLTDGERHRIILGSIGSLLRGRWDAGPLLLLVLAFLLKQYPFRRISNPGPLLCALGMLTIYYLIFVATPYDLAWHLRTTVDRLLLQIWPILLLGFAVLFNKDTEPECPGQNSPQ